MHANSARYQVIDESYLPRYYYYLMRVRWKCFFLGDALAPIGLYPVTTPLLVSFAAVLTLFSSSNSSCLACLLVDNLRNFVVHVRLWASLCTLPSSFRATNCVDYRASRSFAGARPSFKPPPVLHRRQSLRKLHPTTHSETLTP